MIKVTSAVTIDEIMQLTITDETTTGTLLLHSAIPYGMISRIHYDTTMLTRKIRSYSLC